MEYFNTECGEFADCYRWRGSNGSLQQQKMACSWSLETGSPKKTKIDFMPAIQRGHAWWMHYGRGVWLHCALDGKNPVILSACWVWIRNRFVYQQSRYHIQQRKYRNIKLNRCKQWVNAAAKIPANQQTKPRAVLRVKQRNATDMKKANAVEKKGIVSVPPEIGHFCHLTSWYSILDAGRRSRL